MRTDPTVQAMARYVLECALDPALPEPERPARRSGVMRTTAVTTRTTLLLVRLRFQLTLPGEETTRQLVAEDARVLAFEGAPHRADWLPDSRAERLLAAQPTGNVLAGPARTALDKHPRRTRRAHAATSTQVADAARRPAARRPPPGPGRVPAPPAAA